MSKIYDLSQLEELAGGMQEFVMSMVDTFLEHTPGQLEEIKSNYADGNMEKVGAIAHKIKPNIDLFGITEIKQTIRDIEAKGKEGQDDPELKADIAYLDEVLNKAFDQLRELRAQ